MKYEMKEQVAFIAASMITSMTDLRALKDLVAADAAPYRDAASLDRIGRQVADHMSALHTQEGAEAYLLLSILVSDEMAEKVM